jgi:hypothetical protein
MIKARDNRMREAAGALLAACEEAEEWLDNHGGDAETDPGLAELLGNLRGIIAFVNFGKAVPLDGERP